jgi:hypothetical protein
MENFKDEIYLAMLERTIKRLWILALISVLLLVGTNAAWLYYESQFEDVSTTIDASQDGSGTNIIGGGDVNYGAEGQDN